MLPQNIEICGTNLKRRDTTTSFSRLGPLAAEECVLQ